MMLDGPAADCWPRNPTMPAAEQAALAARYARTRDPRDAERLVLANLRLVVKLARELGAASRRPHGPRPGGQRRADARGVAVRSSPRREADDLRGLVDPRLHHAAPHGPPPGWSLRTTTREGRRRFFERTLPAPTVRSRPRAPIMMTAGPAAQPRQVSSRTTTAVGRTFAARSTSTARVRARRPGIPPDAGHARRRDLTCACSPKSRRIWARSASGLRSAANACASSRRACAAACDVTSPARSASQAMRLMHEANMP